MLRQAENKVKIEGILSEINLDYKSFEKNGVKTDAIGGNIKIKTVQKLNNKDVELEIPVQMFASKLTTKGTSNPAYESIERVMKEYNSIAAVGEADADKVRITSGQITMNEYYPKGSEKLVSFPRISASFITKVKPTEYKPEASFSAEFVVGSKTAEVNRDGEETGRIAIKAIIPQYGGKVDVVPMYSSNENVANALSEYWEDGATVKAVGRLNFSQTTKTEIIESGFGEPEEKTSTINVSELLITGGSSDPLTGEFEYDTTEIQEALAERKERLEAEKVKSMSQTSSKATPATNKKGTIDLGF